MQACFDSTSYALCNWKHGSVSGSFYNAVDGCYVAFPSDSYMIKCSSESDIVESSLTLLTSVPMGNNLFTMFCSSGDNPYFSTNVSVQSEHV